MIESKSGKISVLDTFCVCLSLWRWGLGCGWELDAPVRNDIVTPRHLLSFESRCQGQGQGKRAWMRTLWGGCAFASTPEFHQMCSHPYLRLAKSRASCTFAFASRIASLPLKETMPYDGCLMNAGWSVARLVGQCIIIWNYLLIFYNKVGKKIIIHQLPISSSTITLPA